MKNVTLPLVLSLLPVNVDPKYNTDQATPYRAALWAGIQG